MILVFANNIFSFESFFVLTFSFLSLQTKQLNIGGNNLTNV